MDVAQQREGDAVGARERLVAERAVTADGEQGSAASADLARDLAQVAELGASDPSEVVTVEDEDDIAPAEVAERDGTAARRGEAEVGGRLAEPERRHGGECTPTAAREAPAAT